MIRLSSLLRPHAVPAQSVFGGAVGAAARTAIACSLLAGGAARGEPVDEPPAPPAGRLVPGGTNGAKYLCVFGPEGDKHSGATKAAQVIWIRTRRTQSQPVSIHVFDPGSGNQIDRANTSLTTTKYTGLRRPRRLYRCGCQDSQPHAETGRHGLGFCGIRR